MLLRIVIFLVIAFFSTCTLSMADTAVATVKEGNRLFNDENYDEALKNYNEAKVSLPDSPIISFNMGSAYYKKEEFQKAEEAFTRALTTEDPKLEAQATYNIGNSKYKQGKLKENTNLSEAIAYYRASLDYYKRAVDIDKGHRKARYNHELVEKQLKILLDRKKNEPPPENQQKEQNQQNKQCPLPPKPGEGGEKQEEEAEKEQQPAEQKQEQNQSQGESEENRQEESKGGEENRQEGSAMAEEQEGMSEEEAKMILDSHNEEELPFGELQRGGRGGRIPEVLKDW